MCMSCELFFCLLIWMFIVWYVYLLCSPVLTCCKPVGLDTVMYLTSFTSTIYLLQSAIVSLCWWSSIVLLRSKCFLTTLRKYRFVMSKLSELLDSGACVALTSVCRESCLWLFCLNFLHWEMMHFLAHSYFHDLHTMQGNICRLGLTVYLNFTA